MWFRSTKSGALDADSPARSRFQFVQLVMSYRLTEMTDGLAAAFAPVFECMIQALSIWKPIQRHVAPRAAVVHRSRR